MHSKIRHYTPPPPTVFCQLGLIEKSGFVNIVIQKEKVITLPDDILKNYLNQDQLKEFREGTAGIFSITVYAEKPADKACCDPGCCG